MSTALQAPDGHSARPRYVPIFAQRFMAPVQTMGHRELHLPPGVGGLAHGGGSVTSPDSNPVIPDVSLDNILLGNWQRCACVAQ